MSSSSARAFLDQVRRLNTASSIDQGPFLINEECVGWVRRRDVWPVLAEDKENFRVERATGAVHWRPHSPNETMDDRSSRMARLLDDWRQRQIFPCLRKWRNELYPVYSRASGRCVMVLERAAASLFGVRIYGCHMTGYVRPSSSVPPRVWVARRSTTKQTNPGMLDNMVGGGLPYGVDPRTNVIKEAAEEAAIPLHLATGARYAGWISLAFDADRGLVNETDYVFDLELPEDFVPRPADGEVQEFFLCSVEELKRRLLAGEFTPETTLVNIDFLLRHGHLNDADEALKSELVHILRSPLKGLPMPRFSELWSRQWVWITGYGAFDRHTINPSWQAVKGLPDELGIRMNDEKHSALRVKLVKEELPVIYDRVSRRYDEQFPPTIAHHSSPERPCPLLVIHVGVAGGDDFIRLEQQAFNQTHGKDVSGKESQSGRVDERDPAHQIRLTTIDLPQLRQYVIKHCETTHSFTPRITISQDPGRYLCNFIYYKGLQAMGPSIVLFVHVPEEGRPHSITELTTTLQHIVQAALITGRGTFSA